MKHTLSSHCHMVSSYINSIRRLLKHSSHPVCARKCLSFPAILGCFLLLLLAFSTPVFATDYTTDDNCPSQELTLKDMKYQLGDNTTIDTNTTNIVQPAFSITRVPPGTCKNSNGDTVACDTYCNSTTSGEVAFCYDNSITATSEAASFSGTCPASKIYHLNAAQTVLVGSNWFQAIMASDTICVQVFSKNLTPTNNWITLGCKKDNTSAITSSSDYQASCYVDASCSDGTLRHTKTFFSPSSAVVECVEQTLRHIFIDSSGCPGRTNLFTNFQNAMRKTVGVALSLYVIFFGIKVILGQNAPSKGECFSFALKMALVIYFSIGNGVQGFLYPTLVDSMFALSEMMYQAGNNSYDASGNVVSRGLCEFDTSDYPKAYSNIALFDSIDCRMGVYLMISSKGAPMFLMMLVPALLTGQIFAFIFSLIFGVFLLSIMIFIVHSFIMSLIILTLVSYLAPLFVPLALFSYTKKFYDNWIKSLLFGVLQPLVLFSFVALMLTIFDQLFYGDCKFRNQGGALANYVIDVAASPSSCSSTMGYKMTALASTDFLSAAQKFFSFWKISTIENTFDDAGTMVLHLATLTLFLYLFYYYVEIIAAIAEELVGGPQNRALISTKPMDLFNKAKGAVGDSMKGSMGAFNNEEIRRDDEEGEDEIRGDGKWKEEEGTDAPVSGEK